MNFRYLVAYKCANMQEQEEMILTLKNNITVCYLKKNSSYFYLILREGGYCTNDNVVRSDTEVIKNKDLFIALAHCTHEQYGIAGEWWKVVKPTIYFKNEKLYKAEKPIDKPQAFIDDKGNRNGYNAFKFENTEHFVKATKEDLEEYFKSKPALVTDFRSCKIWFGYDSKLKKEVFDKLTELGVNTKAWQGISSVENTNTPFFTISAGNYLMWSSSVTNKEQFDKEYASIKSISLEDLNISYSNIMKNTQTISQEKLLYYLEQASKHKPKLVSVLMEQFPKVWEKEFVVTKSFYDFVLKEIGDCAEWQKKLKEAFPEFNIPKYDIEKGELCFVSDTPEYAWIILKFVSKDNYDYKVSRLDDSFVTRYNFCVPMREVKAPHQIPVKGVHY